ncbi:transposase [Klebsiella pneumoniae]|uniref:transposase n=1 Tax=Klebsiella pneumoniae complex TaxID=3390273 RepID=UPI00211B3CBF|nr:MULTISPECIES: transposase [Klebsiella]
MSTIFGVHYPLRNFRICQTVLRRRLPEIAEYCRKKGLYPEQLIQWKQGFMQTEHPGDKAALKQSQKENKALKKELVRKEKALAEAAAILVLRKKLRDYYGETDGED